MNIIVNWTGAGWYRVHATKCSIIVIGQSAFDKLGLTDVTCWIKCDTRIEAEELANIYR